MGLQEICDKSRFWTHVATFSNAGHQGKGKFTNRRWLARNEPGKSNWQSGNTFGTCNAYLGMGTPTPQQSTSGECKAAAWNTVKGNAIRVVEYRQGKVGIREWTLNQEYTMKELLASKANTNVYAGTILRKDPGTNEMAMATTTDIPYLRINQGLTNDGCRIQTQPVYGECASGIGCILDGQDNRDRLNRHYCVADVATNANGAWRYNVASTTVTDHYVWLFMLNNKIAQESRPGLSHVATFSNIGHRGKGNFASRQWLVTTDPGKSNWLKDTTFGKCVPYYGVTEQPTAAQMSECKSALWNHARSDTLTIVERRGKAWGVREYTLIKEYTMLEIMALDKDTSIYKDSKLLKNPNSDELAFATSKNVNYLKVKNGIDNDGCMIQSQPAFGECASGVGCILDGQDNRDRLNNHYCVADVATNANGKWRYSMPETTIADHTVWFYMGKDTMWGSYTTSTCTGEKCIWKHVATFSNNGHKGKGNYASRNWLARTNPGKNNWEGTGTFGNCVPFWGSGSPTSEQQQDCKTPNWNSIKGNTLRIVERRSGKVGIREYFLNDAYTMQDLLDLGANSNVFAGTVLKKDPGTNAMAFATSTNINYLRINNNLGNDGCRIQSQPAYGECASGVGCILDGQDNRDRLNNHYCVADVATNANKAWKYNKPSTTVTDHTVWMFMLNTAAVEIPQRKGLTHVATFSNNGHKGKGNFNSRNWLVRTDPGKTNWLGTGTFGACQAYFGIGDVGPTTNQVTECKAAAWSSASSDVMTIVEFRAGVWGVREYTLNKEYTMSEMMSLKPGTNIYKSSRLVKDPKTNNMAFATSKNVDYLRIKAGITNDGCMIQSQPVYGECASGVGCILDGQDNRDRLKNHYCVADVATNAIGQWRYNVEATTRLDHTVWLYMGKYTGKWV